MSDLLGSFNRSQKIKSISDLICQCLVSMFNAYNSSIHNQASLVHIYNEYEAICEGQRQKELETFCNNYLSFRVPYNTSYQDCSLNYLNFCSSYDGQNQNNKARAALVFFIFFVLVGCILCCSLVFDNQNPYFNEGWSFPNLNAGPAAAFNSLNNTINIRDYINRQINTLGVEGLDEVTVEDENLTCVICMDKFVEDRQNVVVSLECNHLFHRNCLLPWFQEHQSCPICREEQFQDNL